MSEPPGLLGLLAGSLQLRPYVFLFLAVYLLTAATAWGGRRTVAFTLLAGTLAFAAEWTSTRVGVPFGLYHYTGVTRGRELYLDNVPFFDPLSFTFLAFASLGTARWLARPPSPLRASGPWALALLAGVLMAWLDLVIDPLAVRGDRWFLGRIFYYPEPGRYFGVPVANFLGWVALGTAIARGWLALAGGDGARAARGGRAPAALAPVLLYYLVLGFNLALTGWIGEWLLLGSGLLLHGPLLALVVCCVVGRRSQGS